MTISYQFNVHTASFAGFAKLLIRWKGSVYKLVVKETLFFGVVYAIVSLIYRIGLGENQRRTFENVARHIGDNKNLIPLTFVLGFYVQFVVGRWWDQYNHYPWPDRILSLIIMYIPGLDERSRMIRRTLARWTCVSTILLTRGVSVVAKKRFPTLQHFIDVGLLTQEESDLYETVNIPYAKYWVPMLWFMELLKVAKKEKRFDDPTGIATKHIMEEVATFRTNQWRIWSFDWVSVPIVYTQVTTLAVYVYFLGCLFSRQFLDPTQEYQSFYVDFYFPIFTFLQFFFYVGWLKVAESLINPWGEDDDDFEVNWFIDRHVQVSFLMVDEKFGQLPTLVKDKYWDKTEVVVPYTSARALSRRKSAAHIASTMNLEIPLSSQKFVEPMTEIKPRFHRVSTSAIPRIFRSSFPGRRRHSSICTSSIPSSNLNARMQANDALLELAKQSRGLRLPKKCNGTVIKIPNSISEAAETSPFLTPTSSPDYLEAPQDSRTWKKHMYVESDDDTTYGSDEERKKEKPQTEVITRPLLMRRSFSLGDAMAASNTAALISTIGSFPERPPSCHV